MESLTAHTATKLFLYIFFHALHGANIYITCIIHLYIGSYTDAQCACILTYADSPVHFKNKLHINTHSVRENERGTETERAKAGKVRKKRIWEGDVYSYIWRIKASRSGRK